MPIPQRKTSNSNALALIATVLLAAFVIGMLFFAREVLIPLALAALLTFLLAPLVTRLERWFGRVMAVLVVVTMIFAAMGGAGWILTRQIIDLATKLPDYKENIVTKLQTFRVDKGSTLSAVTKTVEDLQKELPGGADETATPTITQSAGKPGSRVTSRPAPPTNATPVRVVETSKASSIDLIRTMVAPLLGPLGMAALVLLLVIFMLLQREDLRSRLIRLMGQGRISATTRAMDDAGERVSRYLFMQLIMNVSYGVLIAIGLYFIGLPNAVLWGGFAAMLRFIPYVGPWIGAAMPVVLAVAVSPGWMIPLFTFGLFVVLELLSSNVVEPWLYKASTGVSSIALIVGAVGWTWIWGPVGLVLAIPLTVCLVVMGRHVPRLAFLTVLLSDEEALTPAEDCYHRLLRPGDADENEFVHDFLSDHSITDLYDSVFIPVITMAEIDARDESLEVKQLERIEQSLREIIQDLSIQKPATAEVESVTQASESNIPAKAFRVYCVGARAARDDLACSMLANLLQLQGYEAQIAPRPGDLTEFISALHANPVDALFISVVSPSTIIHARYLSRQLRLQLPQMKILVGIWGATEEINEARQRLQDSGADEIAVSLSEAVGEIEKLASPPAESGSANSAKHTIRPDGVVNKEDSEMTAETARAKS